MALAAVEESRAGETLNRSYLLEERVGGDRFREVYRARDVRAARTVTIELLRPEFALAPQVAGRFVAEFEALLPLGHPNLLGVHAIERDETGIPFAVRDFAEGQALALMLEQFPHGMPLGLAMTLLVPICEALAAAHEHDIAHGRVDGEHVILVAHGGATVPMLSGLGSSVEPTAAAAPLRAPEQRRGHGAEPRSDVWALGRLLYQTLSGQAPPEEGDPLATLDELAPHLPTALGGLIGRCLASNPLARPRTAAHVARELSQLRGGLVAARHRAAATAASQRPRGRIGGRKTVEERAHAQLAPETEREPSEPQIELGQVDEAELAFMSTAAARAGSAPPARPLPAAPPALGDTTPAADALADTLGDDEPEIVVEAEPPPLPEPAAAAAPVISMRAVAAAFMPLEGADEQAVAEAAPGEPPAAPTGRLRPAGKKHEARGEARATARKSATELGPKALRERVDRSQGAHKPAVVVVRDGRKRTRRAFGFLWFFLFCIALVPALPLLLDDSRAEAQALFGERLTLAGAGLSILAVVSLIRSWAIQIKSKPMLIAPVTWSLKVVTFCICAVVAGWFLPAGALGPIEGLARSVLPWGAGGFFLFLGAYALLKGIRELPHATFVALVALVCGMASLFGSYRATMIGVQARASGGRAILRARHPDGGQGDYATPDAGASEDEDIDFDPGRIRDMMRGDLGAAEEGEPPSQRHEVGSSEASDMETIEEIRRSRHKRGDAYDGLRDKIPELVR